MIPKYIHKSWLPVMIASLCLWSVTNVHAQGRGGGATGGGGGGGGGGARGGGAAGGGAAGGGARSSGSSSSRDYGSATQLGDATITYDNETRSMIVVSDPKTFSSVSNVIHNLDLPKPQVLIKVVFMEVTHDNDLDIGVEASYTKNIGGSLAKPGNNLGLTNLFGAFASGTSGGSTMPTGAGLYAITGNDFTATMRAIQATGNAEILSRPSIMVRNNQPANIQIGERIPIITSTTYNTTGGANSAYSYQQVGILLQVQPFITADGLVQMIVMPEISELSSQSITISAGVSIPVITSRSASTVVVTPDRQPVVIGGLMNKVKSTTETKIPLLGDIPYLGYLFKRHQMQASKVELVIFLTPYVVNAPSAIGGMNQDELRRTEMLSEIPQNDVDRFIDTIPLSRKNVTTTKEAVEKH